MIEECIARMFIAVYHKKFEEYAQNTIAPHETRLATLIEEVKRQSDNAKLSVENSISTLNTVSAKRRELRNEANLIVEEMKKDIKDQVSAAASYAVDAACKEALDKLGDIKSMMEDTIKELNDRYEEARQLNEAAHGLPLTITAELMKYVAACKEAGIDTTPEERLAFMDKLLNAKSIDANKEVSVLEIESGVNSVKQLPSPTTSYSATPGIRNPRYIDRDVSLYSEDEEELRNAYRIPNGWMLQGETLVNVKNGSYISLANIEALNPLLAERIKEMARQHSRLPYYR